MVYEMSPFIEQLKLYIFIINKQSFVRALACLEKETSEERYFLID